MELHEEEVKDLNNDKMNDFYEKPCGNSGVIDHSQTLHISLHILCLATSKNVQKRLATTYNNQQHT